MVLLVIKKAIYKKMDILNLEGQSNRITDSRVMAILVNWWILSIGRVSGVEGLRSTELPQLVFFSHRKE